MRGTELARTNRFAGDTSIVTGALIRQVTAETPAVEVRPARLSRVLKLIQRVEALKRAADAARQNRAQAYEGRSAKLPVTQHHACPICNSRTILRSHRRNAMEMKLTPFMLPYRCDECGARFYLTRMPTVAHSR